MTEDHTTSSTEETHRAAARVLEMLSLGHNRAGATLVALQGHLGAGKTAFVQGVAQTLGVEEPVTSPTFVIEKVYKLPDTAPWERLVHVDAYRLESLKELATIGWDRLLNDPKNLIMLEWPEQVGIDKASCAAWLTFTLISETTRKICVELA